MKTTYQLFRIACYIASPLFFLQKELTPQPVKNILLAFITSVIAVEILLFIVHYAKIYLLLIITPLIVVLLFVFPYRDDLAYFDHFDQWLIYSTIILSMFYFIDKKYISHRLFG